MKLVQFMASAGFGGAEKVFVELTNALADNHDVTAITIRGCQFRSRFSPEVNLVELAANPTRHNPLFHLELLRTLRSLRPDLVHTHAAKGTELVHQLQRFIRLPHLGTKHNDRKGSIFNKLKFVSTVSSRAEQTIAVRDKAQVRVIYNGVAEEHVEEHALPAVFTMLAVGRLDRIKGFHELVHQLSNFEFPCRLLIAGEGPEEESLRELIADLGQRGRVELLGFQENIPQLMHDFHLVVISSFREGGPKVMIEALLYARALISTPVGMVPEVLPPKLQCEQQQLAEKIIDLHGDYNEYCATLQDLRKMRVDDFRLAAIVSRYEDYYAEIVAASSH